MGNEEVMKYGSNDVKRKTCASGLVLPLAGWEVYRKEQRSVASQVQGANLLDRMNVRDFAGLFSVRQLSRRIGCPQALRLSF